MKESFPNKSFVDEDDFKSCVMLMVRCSPAFMQHTNCVRQMFSVTSVHDSKHTDQRDDAQSTILFYDTLLQWNR